MYYSVGAFDKKGVRKILHHDNGFPIITESEEAALSVEPNPEDISIISSMKIVKHTDWKGKPFNYVGIMTMKNGSTAIACYRDGFPILSETEEEVLKIVGKPSEDNDIVSVEIVKNPEMDDD